MEVQLKGTLKALGAALPTHPNFGPRLGPQGPQGLCPRPKLFLLMGAASEFSTQEGARKEVLEEGP